MAVERRPAILAGLIVFGGLLTITLFLIVAVRPLCGVVLRILYRLKIRGREFIPPSGPVLIASNHVTWIDGAFLMAVCPRRPVFLMNAAFIDKPILRTLARRMGLIPVPSSGPRGQRAAIAAAREALDRGEAVVIFPEAQLSRNGLTGPFLRGLEAILHGMNDSPVVPVFLDHLWGSVFSFQGGRTIWKRPRGFRRQVGIAFGPPIDPPVTAFRVRQGVLEAGVRAFELRSPSARDLPETLEPTLPSLRHRTLGLLAASAVDYDKAGIRQIGKKEGTLGQAVPGVALRIVDPLGVELPPDQVGRLFARIADRDDWIDTGIRASIDRDGFVKTVSCSQD